MNGWLIRAGHVPVDRPNVVPGLVLAYLVEVHPLALEDAVVLAGEAFADETVGPNLDLANLFENFARESWRNQEASGRGRLTAPAFR